MQKVPDTRKQDICHGTAYGDKNQDSGRELVLYVIQFNPKPANDKMVGPKSRYAGGQVVCQFMYDSGKRDIVQVEIAEHNDTCGGNQQRIIYENIFINPENG